MSNFKFRKGDKVKLRSDKGYTKSSCETVWTVEEVYKDKIEVSAPGYYMDKDADQFEYFELKLPIQ